MSVILKTTVVLAEDIEKVHVWSLDVLVCTLLPENFVTAVFTVLISDRKVEPIKFVFLLIIDSLLERYNSIQIFD